MVQAGAEVPGCGSDAIDDVGNRNLRKSRPEGIDLSPLLPIKENDAAATDPLPLASRKSFVNLIP